MFKYKAKLSASPKLSVRKEEVYILALTEFFLNFSVLNKNTLFGGKYQLTRHHCSQRKSWMPTRVTGQSGWVFSVVLSCRVSDILGGLASKLQVLNFVVNKYLKDHLKATY